MNASPPQLIAAAQCRTVVFPDAENSGPSPRSWAEWQRRGYIPLHRIGRRVYIDPEEARRALDRRFKVNAVTA